RYVSAAALAEDLERWLGGEPILARPSTRWERWRKWARRRPAAAALVGVSGLAAVLLVASLVVSNYLVRREQAETNRALERETAVNDELARALERERTTSYLLRVARAHQEFQAHHVARADQMLEDCPPELRHWEWNYLHRL